MQSIFNGMRAGTVAALVLTLWAFVAVGDPAGDLSATAGMAFVAATFGLVGLPQIAYGAGLGAIVALWTKVLERLGLSPLFEAVEDPEVDRRVAAGTVAAVVVLGLAAGGTALVHLAVTAGFARDTFQAMGLAMGVGVLGAVAVAVFPLFYGLLEGLMQRLPVGQKGGLWTRLTVGVGVLAAVVATVFGYVYGRGLHVFDDAELQIGMAAVVGVPLLTLVMHRISWERFAWRIGVPTAGTIVGVGCLIGADSWATSTPELRSLTFRDAPVVSTVAPVVIDPGTDDQIAYGDDDADDDPRPVTDPNHPARTGVDRAVGAGDRAQQNAFEEIPDPPENVVFVMIDTLRQDHMGYAGYERDTTPNIDEIAEDAVVFNDAYATSPHTPRTIPPIFFGRYASNLNWILPDTNFPRLTENNTSMYEIKNEAGWQTIAKMSHFYFRERRGVHQGFDVWDNEGHKDLEDSHDDIATPRIWEKLEPTLEQLGDQHRAEGEEADPFSIFVHFFDPHASYNHHDEFPFDRGDDRHSRLVADYDSEIAHADHHVGKIVDKLKEEELYDDTIFVITSDHGEAFDEHGYYFHGQTLYDTVINVPKLVRVPGWFSTEVDGQVSVVDLAPTLLDLLGLRIPSEYDGEVLTDVLLGRSEVPDRPVFAELLPYTAFEEHHRAVVYDDQKLIVDFTHDIEEFYDLADDPMEQNDLIDERAEDAAELRGMLDEFME